MNKFRDLIESPVGMKGRTGMKDAEAHVTPELKANFKKLVKKLGGKTVAGILLRDMNIKDEQAEVVSENMDAEYIMGVLADDDINSTFKNGIVYVDKSEVKNAELILKKKGHKIKVKAMK